MTVEFGLTRGIGLTAEVTQGLSIGTGLSLPILTVLQEALVFLDEDGIVGSAPVTAWTNSGTGGSAFDLDVVVGTGANLTATSELGHTVVASSGGVGLETTAGQDITQPFTVFMVGKYTDAAPATFQFLLSYRSDGAKEYQMGTNSPSSNKFYHHAGESIVMDEDYDQDPHLWTGQVVGTAESKITASGVGSKSGDAGTDTYDFGSIFMHANGTLTAKGYIATLLVFDKQLSEKDVAAIQQFLSNKYKL